MAPLDFLLRLNGRDVEDLGWRLLEPIEVAAPGQDRELSSVPGRLDVLPAQVSYPQPLPLTITLATKPVEPSGRQQRLDELIRWIQRPGLTEIERGEQPGRVHWGLLQSCRTRPRYAQRGRHLGAMTAMLEYVLLAGVAQNRDLEVLRLEADTWTALAGLGTVPSSPLIVIPGAAVDPVLKVAAHDLAVRSSLALTGNVPAGGWWEVHTDVFRVIQAAADGARTDVTGELEAAGDWPVFDPAFGSGELAPVVQSSSAALAYYRAAWWPE